MEWVCVIFRFFGECGGFFKNSLPFFSIEKRDRDHSRKKDIRGF
jgi:hypothetical protein